MIGSRIGKGETIRRLGRVRTELVCSAALVLLVGCWDGSTVPGGDEDTGVGDVQATTTADGRAARTKPLRSEELEPSFSAVGPEGAVPTKIAVHFDRAIAPSGASRPGDATEYRIEPALPGRLEFRSPSTLTFVPEQPFRPDTTYTLSISKLEVRRPDAPRESNDKRGENSAGTRVLEPPKPWSGRFETPPFELERISPAVSTERDGPVAVELTFTAPVDPSSLPAFADWQVDGRPVTEVTYDPGPAPRIARATLQIDRLRSPSRNSEVTVLLEEGLPYDAAIEAPGTRRTTEFRLGPTVRIEDIALREYSDGFYIEVDCGDRARAGPTADVRRWPRHVGSGCEPVPRDARGLVSVRPPAEIETVPTEKGFRISGDFERTSYWIGLSAGLETTGGSVLRRSYERIFDIPARSTVLEIPGSGRYITDETWRNLGVRHRNVERIDVKIRRVPRQNMVFWMSGEDEKAGPRTSNLIAETRVPVEGELDRTTTSWLNVERLVGSPKPGVYELELTAGSQTEIVRVVVTDIHLVVKRAARPSDAPWSREILVWALDMKTNEPLAGVALEAIRKSGDVLARCNTARTGHCRLELPEKSIDPNPPFGLVARRGDSFTYLKYEELETKPPGANLLGEPYQGGSPYSGSFVLDRRRLEPGTTLHGVALLRHSAHRAPPAGTTVDLTVRDPQGRPIRHSTHETNESGAVAFDQPVVEGSETGDWSVEVAVDGDSVATRTFEVETSHRRRLDFTVEPDASEVAADDPTTLTIEATYPFGASTEGSEIVADCRVEPAAFEPEHNTELAYGPLQLEEPFESVSLDGVRDSLGPDGTGMLTCPPVARERAFPTTGRLVATVDLFETGSGRTSSSTVTARVHPERYYLGLNPGFEEVEEGTTYRIEGQVVDWRGHRTDEIDSLRADFVRLHREQLDREQGDADPGKRDAGAVEERAKTSALRYVRETTRRIDVAEDGSFEIRFTPERVGDGYLIRATSGDAVTEVRFEPARSKVWRGPTPNDPTADSTATPPPNPPHALPVEVPDPIRVGRTETATIDAPFPGRALMTVETDQLLQHEWIEVEPGENTWPFQIERFHPNVYVGAFLVKDPQRSTSESDLRPGRAFGMESVEIDKSAYEEKLEIDAPDEVASDEALNVEIEAAASNEPRWVTVAAVDATNQPHAPKTHQKPLNQVFAKRALGVTTHETIGWHLSLPSPGFASNGRANENIRGAVPVRGSYPSEPDDLLGEHVTGRAQLRGAAAWSGLQRLPPDGRTTVELDIPNARGEFEVVAHSFSASKIGHASHRVDIRPPFDVRLEAPPFLNAGDRVEIPVFVTNRTDRDRRFRIGLDVDAAENQNAPRPPRRSSLPVKIDGTSSRDLQLRSGETEAAVFVVDSLARAGATEITATAESGELRARARASIRFDAPRPKRRRVRRIEVEEQRTDLTPYLEGWRPMSEETTFWLTSLNDARSFDGLRRVVRRPYTSLEETVSAIRPRLLIPDLLAAAAPAAPSDPESTDEKVRRGLDRILALQTSKGGFRHWPADRQAYPWTTAYATHLLLDARERGFGVPQVRIDAALDWLEDRGETPQGKGSVANLQMAAYPQYVLARSGRGDDDAILDRLDALPSTPSGPAREASYLLRAALHRAGDSRFRRQLRDPHVDRDIGGYRAGGPFYSHQRRRGLVLNIRRELFGHRPRGNELVDRVARDLERRPAGRFTRHELSWMTTGLGAVHRNRTNTSASSAESGQLLADGSPLQPSSKSARFGHSWILPRASEYETLRLEVDSASSDERHLVIGSEGVPQRGRTRRGSDGLRLRRSHWTPSGESVDFTDHELGDVVFTRLSIANRTDRELNDVAVVDRVPAGWEVEYPSAPGRRLASPVDWTGDWETEQTEEHSGRVAFFGDIEAGATKTVVYAVRATAAGTFEIPPARARALYAPSVRASVRGRRVTVDGPWPNSATPVE